MQNKHKHSLLPAELAMFFTSTTRSVHHSSKGDLLLRFEPPRFLNRGSHEEESGEGDYDSEYTFDYEDPCCEVEKYDQLCSVALCEQSDL